MEEWLEAGSLSQDEFDQLVRLTARYFLFDVDQFDNWLMPSELGPFYVDFSWETRYPESHRTMWPAAQPGENAWVVWREDEDGNKVTMARYANPRAAAAFVAAVERHGRILLYGVDPPPSA